MVVESCVILLLNSACGFLYELASKTLNFMMPQVELKEGPLEQFSHEMEPFLRKQGLPVRLNKGLYFPCTQVLEATKQNGWN